jgi:predicted Zn-dependent protease
VLKLDPSYRDAELTIGLHNYILGSLPLALKLVASVGGMRGSKKRGLEAVERVAREGRWARDVARLLLIDLYKREKRWAEAAAVARELGARYPRNYLLQLQAADALVAQAAALRRAKNAPPAAGADEEREAFRIFDSLLRERAKRNAVNDLIHFRYGEALLAAGQPERAAREFLAPAERATAPPDFATVARQRAAQSLDLAGKRADALAAYRAVLSRPNFQRSHEEARRGLRESYRRQDR